MEQIIDRALLEQVKRQSTLFQEVDPTARAWARLNQVTLNTPTAARHGIVTDTQDPRGVPYDHLRARLLSQVQSSGHKRIGITAIAPGCGHTAFTMTLALAFADLPDFKTILFDFDLRTPKLITMLGLDQIGPRYSALSGTRRDFDSTALRLTEHFAISLNATPESDPTRLLATTKTQMLLQEIEADLKPDLMLFVLPPLTPHADVLMGLPLIDATLVTAAADKTTLQDVDRAERMVAEHSTCLGVLLNRCRFTQNGAL